MASVVSGIKVSGYTYSVLVLCLRDHPEMEFTNCDWGSNWESGYETLCSEMNAKETFLLPTSLSSREHRTGSYMEHRRRL